MIDNYNLILLSGGHHHCDKFWSRKAIGTDRCYKAYFPVSGGAWLQMGSEVFTLRAGQAYLISGFHLVRQHCETEMEVFWVHFVPESLYLHHLISQQPPLFQCRRPDNWPPERLRDLCEIFQNPSSDENLPRRDSSPAADCWVHGALLTLLGMALDTPVVTGVPEFRPELQRLKPAIDFMQLHFQENPTLAEIASHAGMAPNHFHRRFSSMFGRTPFEHMLAQRMNRARNLLASTGLAVKEVSAKVGYEDAAYFTRVFTRRFGLPPSEYRSARSGYGQWAISREQV